MNSIFQCGDSRNNLYNFPKLFAFVYCIFSATMLWGHVAVCFSVRVVFNIRLLFYVLHCFHPTPSSAAIFLPVLLWPTSKWPSPYFLAPCLLHTSLSCITLFSVTFHLFNFVLFKQVFRNLVFFILVCSVVIKFCGQVFVLVSWLHSLIAVVWMLHFWSLVHCQKKCY